MMMMMMMMWGFVLIFSSYFAAQVTSQEIKAMCKRYDGHDFPTVSPDAAPSALADLKVQLVTVGGRQMLNISWAINIDSSNIYLTGTRISISGEPEYRCEYNPPLAQVHSRNLEQQWFHFLVKASYGFCDIEAANLPLPPLGSGHSHKFDSIEIPRSPQIFSLATPNPPQATSAEITPEPTSPALKTKDVTVAVFGGLAGLMILSSCYLIYKNCGSNIAASLGYKDLPALVPVPVLVVYPAENSAFQRAVVALAEFLQGHGGCSVAFDMWHQGKIAELGPMRWLAEQAKATDRVLIVCPGVETSFHCPPNHGFPEPSVPAAARDLYPLILNMVASHAKSAGELAKFWVVQLGERQDKKPSTLAPELRTCRTFRLMKDLKKLCKSLHAARRSNKKISDLLFRPAFSYCENSAAKLKEAVDMLRGQQPSISKEMQPLKSVISTV